MQERPPVSDFPIPPMDLSGIGAVAPIPQDINFFERRARIHIPELVSGAAQIIFEGVGHQMDDSTSLDSLLSLFGRSVEREDWDRVVSQLKQEEQDAVRGALVAARRHTGLKTVGEIRNAPGGQLYGLGGHTEKFLREAFGMHPSEDPQAIREVQVTGIVTVICNAQGQF